MFRFVFCVLFLVISLNCSTPSQAKTLEKQLKETIKYLEEIPEVKWVRVKRNSVIVGWKGFPSRFNLINTEAALKSSQVTSKTIYLWSVRHTQKNWITGTRPYLCKTTARGGKIKETSCDY